MEHCIAKHKTTLHDTEWSICIKLNKQTLSIKPSMTSPAASSPHLHSLNLQLIGVGFRAYVMTRTYSPEDCPFSPETSRYLRPTDQGGAQWKLLMLKVGTSALTAYPIPADVDIYCPTDQQQQADNQPLLLTSVNKQRLAQVAAEIRSYKKADPYKGSGIYLCDRVETDQGETYIAHTLPHERKSRSRRFT